MNYENLRRSEGGTVSRDAGGTVGSGGSQAPRTRVRYALEHHKVLLELNLMRVTDIDNAARTYPERLRARGARILTDAVS